MSDDTMACPKCHPEINNQCPQIPNQSIPSKNSGSKIVPLTLSNVIISTLTLIAVIICILINGTTSNNDESNSNSNSNVVSSTCPADEYGHHEWSVAHCTSPAYCYECGAYKDDTLGEQNFWTSNDITECIYCGILYEVYIDSLD